jgi:hypothetical protein
LEEELAIEKSHNCKLNGIAPGAKFEIIKAWSRGDESCRKGEKRRLNRMYFY